MRTLAITQNITVDGSIEMITDWFDPQGQAAVDMSDVLEESHRQDDRADALLLGRQTFEDFRGYWPVQTEDPTGITAYLDRVAKYVVSSTLTDPGWQNSMVLTGDPVEAIRRLKAEEGQDIVLTGSITLAHTVIAAGWSTSTASSSIPPSRAGAGGSSPRGTRSPGCGCWSRGRSAAGSPCSGTPRPDTARRTAARPGPARCGPIRCTSTGRVSRGRRASVRRGRKRVPQAGQRGHSHHDGGQHHARGRRQETAAQSPLLGEEAAEE